MRNQDVTIYAIINGRKVEREEIKKCEYARYSVAMRKLKIRTNEQNQEKIKDIILNKKLELGQKKIKKLVAVDEKIAKIITILLAKLSKGKYVLCETEFYVKGIHAKEFTEWFHQQSNKNNMAAMLQAHPEHYIIDTRSDGTQIVCETTGGSPVPAGFLICFNDTEAISIEERADCPFKIEGLSKMPNGIVIGSARHQFKDTPDGLYGNLCIAFPKLTPKSMIKGHQYHLAIEFSNWIEAAVSGKYDK